MMATAEPIQANLREYELVARRLQSRSCACLASETQTVGQLMS